jgi:hypothetical protein
MGAINFPQRREELAVSRQDKWIRGLNTLVSATQIRPDELASAIDIELVEDGKVQCPRDGQKYYGNTDGSRVTGLYPYYKSDGTKKLLRTSGTALQVYNDSTSNWDTVSGFTYTTGLNTNGVMAYDKLYLCNGTDHLTYYDGSTITSFTAVSAPSNPTATRTGTTGTYTYSYKISSVTAVGESTPSAAASTDLNVATLDTSSYVTVGWTAASNAIGYNVYGRKAGKWYFMKYLEGNASVSYVDKGQDTPYEAGLPPAADTSNGPIGKHIELFKDSIFIIGDPTYPSRLYYSAGGDLINDFSAANGGGFIDISSNDGQSGTGLKAFKNSLLVFKERSIYQFAFTTSGAPQITQVTAAIGCIAPRSIVQVENDVFFASERGVFTIGNEQGFAFDVLRTNELSARVRSIYQSIAPAYMKNISAVYATKANTNLIIFSYTPSGSTTNTKAIIYDRERIAWYEWTNIKANCWVNYINSDGVYKVLYGDDSSGYVKEILTGSDDFGSVIQGSFQLRAESYKEIDRYKTQKDMTIVLRKPTGSVNMSLIVDGSTTAYSSNIATVKPSINFGHYVFKNFLLGESSGTGSVTSSDEIVERTKRNVNILGRTFALKFDNGSSGSSFTLLSVSTTAKPKSEKYRQSTDLI